MKKSVLASLLALATIFPVSVPMVYGQAAQSGQITIKDPQEYNDYTNAVGQSTPAAKAAAIETFLTKYPNSVVKNDLLEQLMADLSAGGRHDEDPEHRGSAARGGPGKSARIGHFGLHREIPGRYQRPLLLMRSQFWIRRQPRPRPVSALPSRRACPMPTFRS